MNEENPHPTNPEGPSSDSAAYSSMGTNVQGGEKKNPETHNPTKVTEITTEADFNHHTSTIPSSALHVIYFHAPWAAPCKQMSTILEALASTYPALSPPTISFLSINAEELPEVSETYDVTAVPYVVLQKDGKTVDTISGSDASKVRTAVEKHAGKSGDPGKLGLPAAQQVTRPTQEPVSLDESKGQSNGDTSGARNLSSYAPDATDPNTAPDYSSGKENKDELFQRLSELVKAAPVMLFMKGTPSAPQCGFSRQTVQLLRERSVRYGFFNILADDEVRQGLKEFSDWPTFPQLYVDGELVGGLDIVREELDNNPDFLQQYSVAQKSSGSAAAPQSQAQTA